MEKRNFRNFRNFKEGHWYIYCGDSKSPEVSPVNTPIQCNKIWAFSGHPCFNVPTSFLLTPKLIPNWKIIIDNFIEIEPSGTKVIKSDTLYNIENKIYFPAADITEGKKSNFNFAILKRSETDATNSSTLNNTISPELKVVKQTFTTNIFTKPKKEKIVLGINKRTTFIIRPEKYIKFS